jgi:hypothetical protein
VAGGSRIPGIGEPGIAGHRPAQAINSDKTYSVLAFLVPAVLTTLVLKSMRAPRLQHYCLGPSRIKPTFLCGEWLRSAASVRL